ncbi:MAG: protein translocase subunit SecF [Dehalococcoidia bacterium]|nr:protein translocase subunit SecF [Dehalococcoidia bacterium]
MKTLDLVSNRKWLFLASGVSALVALVLLAIPPTLRPGIEFTSGTTMLLLFQQPVQQPALRDELARLGHADARIQSTGASEFLMRTKSLQVPEGSFSEVEPGGPATQGGATVRLGAEGASGDVVLRAVRQGDPCQFGIEAATLPAGTEARVLEQHRNCPSGAVYRVQALGNTGYIAASDTHALVGALPTPVPTASATPAATAVPTAAATAAAGATDASATPSASAPPAVTATPRPPAPGERGTIETALQQRFGPFEVKEFATVSPVVSKVAVRNASVAVVIAAFAILAYIAFAFSSVPRPIRYGACAIIATLHDVIIVLGAFSLFGKLFHVEVNLMFVTGLLTVIGFSVHDTIVVFDRIRENVRLAPTASLADNVNAALVQTIGRSLNTSITVLLTVLALLLLGGVTIQSFLLVLLVGIVAGTYSSVGIAAQLLVSWDEGDFGRAFDRLRGRRPAPAVEAERA